MVRFPLTTGHQIHPPKPISNSISTVERCISLFNSGFFSQIIASGLHHHSFVTDKINRVSTSQLPRARNPKDTINFATSVNNFSKNLKTSYWNDLIRAYATSNDGSHREAIWVFLEMRRLGIKPDEHTFPFVFKSCSSFLGLNEGKQIHADVIKQGLYLNVYVQNTLIHFYGSCKKILDSYQLFDEMSRRTVVSWNSIITAAVECSWFYNSLDLFVKMRNSGFEPDETTMVVILSACAELGNLSLGKWIHSQVIEKDMEMNFHLGTALVDMYGKCGAVDYAGLVFDRMANRNVWTWSAMILGFAQHGFAKQALELFKKMRNCSIKPNHVTFLGLLCACSHAGLMEDGKYYFYEMEHVHGIKPAMAHYGAMVDILSRSGRLKDAYAFILDMPVEADGVVWRTLLSACNIYDVKDSSGVGEKVRKKLIELEPKRSGNFVMLANNYAELEMWEKATHVRSKMRNKGLKKKAGESCLEVCGSVFRFISGDCFCVASDEVFLLLSVLNLHIRTTEAE